jgi:hypothetical protein
VATVGMGVSVGASVVNAQIGVGAGHEGAALHMREASLAQHVSERFEVVAVFVAVQVLMPGTCVGQEVIEPRLMRRCPRPGLRPVGEEALVARHIGPQALLNVRHNNAQDPAGRQHSADLGQEPGQFRSPVEVFDDVTCVDIANAGVREGQRPTQVPANVAAAGVDIDPAGEVLVAATEVQLQFAPARPPRLDASRARRPQVALKAGEVDVQLVQPRGQSPPGLRCRRPLPATSAAMRQELALLVI